MRILAITIAVLLSACTVNQGKECRLDAAVNVQQRQSVDAMAWLGSLGSLKCEWSPSRIGYTCMLSIGKWQDATLWVFGSGDTMDAAAEDCASRLEELVKPPSGMDLS